MYNVDMTEMKYSTTVTSSDGRSTTPITMMSRMYTTDTKTSYAAEVEMDGEITNVVLRRVVAIMIGIVGCPKSPRPHIDAT